MSMPPSLPNVSGTMVPDTPRLLVTVTVNVQLSVFPLLSAAIQVTVVTPSWNTEPEAGMDVVVVPVQLSVAVIAFQFTIAVQPALFAWTEIFEGQVTTGDSTSFTVTANEQESSALVISVARYQRVVVPTGKYP